MTTPRPIEFQDFPREIQELVWDSAAQKENVVHAVLVPKSTKVYQLPMTIPPVGVRIALTPEIQYITTPAPPVELMLAHTFANGRVQDLHHIVRKDDSKLWKCKELKKAGKFKIKNRFYANFDSDIFYFELRKNARSIADTLKPRTVGGAIPDAPAIFGEICNLAIDLDMEELEPPVADPSATTLGDDMPQPFSMELALDQFLHKHVFRSIKHFPKLKTLTFVIKQVTDNDAINWNSPARFDIGGIVKLELRDWRKGVAIDELSGLHQNFPLTLSECERIEEKLVQWFEIIKVFGPELENVPKVALKLGSVRGLFQRERL